MCLIFPWMLNTNFTKVLFSMVMFYLFFLYRSSSHIMTTISQLKKTCSSFLLLWGKMTLTILLMLRYISYKSFIVYFSLYSNVHYLSCLILCIVYSFFFQKMNSVLIVRSSNWRKRRTMTLEQKNVNEKERRELV